MTTCFLNAVGLGEYRVTVRTRPRWNSSTFSFSSENIGELLPTNITWGRAVDATSTAAITVNIGGNADRNCCALLSQIVPVAMEVRIYRDGQEVWLGPIVSLDFQRDQAILNCSDLSWWFGKRRFVAPFNPNGFTFPLIETFNIAVDNVRNLLLPVGGPDPLYFENATQILPATVSDDRQYSTSQLVSDAISDLQDSVVDWTMYRSVLYAREFELSPDISPEVLRDNHTQNVNGISLSGVDMSTRSLVLGNPADIQGEAFAATGTATDQLIYDVFGLVDRVWTDDSESLASAQVSADTKFDLTKLKTAQVANLDVQLNPTAPFEINDLVPGLKARVSITHPCRTIDQVLRLVSMSASVSASGEIVSVQYESIGATG